MLSQIKKLIKHSAVYGLGLIASSITALILTPLFLHRLARADYGMNEILNTFTSMLCNILLLGIGSVFIKVYVNDCRDDQERKNLVTSVTIFTGAVGIALILLTHFFSHAASALLLKSGKHGLLIQLAAMASGMLLVQQMAMLCLRAKQVPGRFIMVTICQFITVIGMNFYFVFIKGMGVFGIQIGSATACFVSLVMALIMIRTELAGRFSRRLLKHLLILALPLIPASITPWILNMSDRYFLNHSWGFSETGLYAVGYKIGMLGLMIFINAFQLAWSPLFYANDDEKGVLRLCANVLKHYTLLLVSGGLLFSVFAPEILRIIARPEYWSAYWIVPYIGLSYVLYGMHFYAVPLFVKAEQGKWLGIQMAVVGILNLVLNLVLIPSFGIRGAIAATLASFAILMVSSLWQTRRWYAIPYQYANTAKTLILAAGVYLAYRHIQGISVSTALIKLTALPAYLVLLYIMRFFGPREIELIQSIPGRAIQKLSPRFGKSI